MQQIVDWILKTTLVLGYPGVFILMAVESSVIPVPSEVVLIPAGYLAYKGHMSIALLIVIGTAGSLAGSLANYYISRHLGRVVVDSLIARYGNYILVKFHHLQKSERYFETNGEITIFIARLLPGVRHLISIPAGLSRMNVWRFSVYTIIGAGLWNLVLIIMGYFFGANEALIRQNLKLAAAATAAFIVLVVAVYVYFKVYRPRRARGAFPGAGDARLEAAVEGEEEAE